MKSLKLTEILKLRKELFSKVSNKNGYNIKILSNISCNQIKDVLEYNLLRHDIMPVISLGNYDNIIQDSYLKTEDKLVIVHYDLFNIVEKMPFFQEGIDYLDLDSLIEDIKSEIDIVLNNLSSVPTILFNTFSSLGIYSNPSNRTKSVYIENKLNEYLYSLSAKNLVILNVGDIIAKIGVEQSFDLKMFHLSRTLYSLQFTKEYVYAISSVVFRFTGKVKKAIIFDCDNTLWKGILGEDGEDGIDMSLSSNIGSIYNKVQQIIHWLSKQGVIIGLCSKNNEEDVSKVLESHPDIVFSKDDIVISKINWNDKATNFREIASDLNIGLDSLVFVDDSSFEINLIKEKLPEVLTLQVPTAIYEYPNLLLDIVNKYFYLSESSEDLEKTKQYKAQVSRNKEKNNAQSIDDYIASLDILINLKENDFSQINRLAQLTQKTNQFNLTTRRYSENEIDFFLKDDKINVLSIGVIDKFGDNGLTGLCILKLLSGETAYIDSLLMSCRIMGRQIEKVFMDAIVKYLQAQKIIEIKATYIPTEKNKPVVAFYDELGFTVEEGLASGEKRYCLRIDHYIPSNIEYIKIK